MRTSLLIGLSLALLASCGPNKFEFEKTATGSTATDPNDPGNPCVDGCTVNDPKKLHFDYIEVTPNNRSVDILVVDDNSGSMSQEQANMGMRFPNFIASLQGLDWRVGITTTDVTGTGAQGHLLTYKNTVLKYIDMNTPNAATLFDDTVQIGIDGSGDERGIYAANLAVNLNEAQWLRPAAHLAVIIMSDEDERSDGTNLEQLDTPDDLIANVKNKLGLTKTFSAHAIITRPADTNCLNTTGQSYGNTYADLVTKTNGILGDICAADYGAQIADIGKQIQSNVDSIALKCTPIAGTLTVGYSPAPAMTTTYTINKEKVLFAPSLAGGTKVHVAYDCPVK